MKPLSLAIAALASVCVTSLAGRTQTGPPPAPPGPPGFVFTGLVGGANPAPQTITVTNTAGPGSPLQVTGSQPSWLTVAVTNQAAQATVTASVDLSGLPAGVRQAVVELISNRKLIKKLFVWLAMTRPLPNDSAYQVELRYTGYTGLAEAYPDCAVNPQGFDVLTGIVAGREAVPAGDDVVYRGTLGRMTVIDFCEQRGKRGPNDDERVWCSATLTGVASMNVELEVYGESDRGAWVKAEPDGSWFTGGVSGDCESADMRAWEQEYPDGSSGGSPSGQPIDESVAAGAPRLFAGGRARLVVGSFPPRRPTGRFGRPDGWSLKVISKLR